MSHHNDDDEWMRRIRRLNPGDVIWYAQPDNLCIYLGKSKDNTEVYLKRIFGQAYSMRGIQQFQLLGHMGSISPEWLAEARRWGKLKRGKD